MSSPPNPNQTPGRPTGNGSNSQPDDPAGNPPDWWSVSPSDPTRTQWPPAVAPGRPAPGPQTPGPQTPGPQAAGAPRVSPTEPTLTQWTPAAPLPAEPQPLPAAQAAAQAARPATRKTARRGPRSLFWPGFAAGFLLLAAISCGVLTAALGLNRLTLDDIRGSTGAAWTPMPVTPTAALAEAALDSQAETQPGAISTRFTAGQSVRNMTNSRVNIRMTPGYLGKTGSDVIGQLEAGQALTILGDPTVTDELTWWRIQTDSNGQAVVGWVAEATASGVQILGATP